MCRFLSAFFYRILPWIVLTHALVFIIFWLTNSLFYASTNDYLADMLGRRLDFVSLLIWISLFIAAWSAFRIVMAYLKKKYRLAAFFSWAYGFVSLVYIIFFYGSFQLLFSESPVQLVRIGQMLGYFRFFLDAALLLGFALAAAFILRRYLKSRSGRSGWILILALLIFAFVWSLPLFFTPAGVSLQPLPDKPLLIAHRGASMLAPENTQAAANLATELGAYGLETDIHVSRDGELFLLHDETFDRTTDIKTVLPGREEELAENFTLAEISQLNAGKWFLEQDPYLALKRGLLSPEQVEQYKQQAVPLLTDWLDIARQNHLVFLFDLKQPPVEHAYAGSFFDQAFDLIHQAGIDRFVWFLVDETQIETLRTAAPEMLPAAGVDYHSPPSTDELIAQGYKVVNAEYGIDPGFNRQYQDAGLWVNLYTVDEPWQFSRLWLLGVDSITTSNAGVMAKLTRPFLSMSFSLYLALWILVGLIGAGLIIGLVYPVIRTKPGIQPMEVTD
jgi:glycerophosphoryl diester phosphodiesterase